MELLSAFVFCISCSFVLSLFIRSRRNCRPTAQPCPIRSSFANIANSNSKKIRVPETFVSLSSYLSCFSPGTIALHKMEMIYKLVAWEEIKICDTAAGDLSCKQVWRVIHGSVLRVTICVSSGTDSSSHSGKIRAVTEEGGDAHPEGLLVYIVQRIQHRTVYIIFVAIS